MTLYSLTETYSEIYDHRKVEDLFDNLRFVDYLQDEDIQEVVEELVWEFRDYGNTLEEAFEMLDHAVTVPVLYESYDELIGDVLYEATLNPYAPAGSAAARQYSQYTAKSKARQRELSSDPGRRAADRASRLAAANTSVKKRIENASNKLSGPISSVKQSISGAAGGMGRAAKALGGAAVKKGQAMLKSLLRRGGKALTSTGQSIEGSGVRASQQAPKTKSVRVGKTTLTATKEPGGSKRQMVGKAIKRVADVLHKAGAPSSKLKDQPPRSPLPPRTPLPQSYHSPITTQKVTGGFDPSKSSSQNKKPYGTGKQETSKGVSYSKLSPKQAKQFGSQQPVAKRRAKVGPPEARVAPGTLPQSSTTRGLKKKPGDKVMGEKEFKLPSGRVVKRTVRIREDYELEQILQYISEDLIDAGYAYNIDEAHEIINDLDESTLTEIIYDYLEE